MTEQPDDVYARDDLVVNPPEDEPGPATWDEPVLDIPWWEKVLDFIFGNGYRFSGR